MAITYTLEKLTGNAATAWQLNLVIYDTGTPPAALTVDQVIAYLNTDPAGIPTQIDGIPDDGDPHVVQISNTMWRVTINYRVNTLRPLHPVAVGASRSRFNFQVGRKFVRYAAEVAKYPSSAMSAGGVVNVVTDIDSGTSTTGVWLEPPPISFVNEQSFAPGTVTAAWIRTLAAVIQAGAVNSDALGGGAYAIGELMIGYCVGQQISTSAFSIETGWCWQANVTGEVRGPVTGISYQGHDFVWESYALGLDRAAAQMHPRVESVYVNRVRPRVAFSGLGVSPP